MGNITVTPWKSEPNKMDTLKKSEATVCLLFHLLDRSEWGCYCQTVRLPVCPCV